MKVILYTRVSTTDKQTNDSQLHELRDYCARRGWKDIEEVHDAASGAKTSRAGFDSIMQKARRGKIDVLLAFKLDRIGRSLSHLAQIFAELKTNKVALVIPSQGIDTTNANPAADLQINILSCVAEYERAIIQERVNAGLAAARARGVKLGRTPTLSTYYKKAIELSNEGLSGRKIAEALQIPVGSVGKMLRDAKKSMN